MHSFEVSKLLESYMVAKVILWSNNFFFLCSLPIKIAQGLTFYYLHPRAQAEWNSCYQERSPFLWQKKTGPWTFKMSLPGNDSISSTYNLGQNDSPGPPQPQEGQEVSSSQVSASRDCRIQLVNCPNDDPCINQIALNIAFFFFFF